MEIAQPLHDSGHAVRFKSEGGEDEKPEAMPLPDAHANKHYLGRSGKLKAGRPLTVSKSGNAANIQGHSAVQRSRKRSK